MLFGCHKPILRVPFNVDFCVDGLQDVCDTAQVNCFQIFNVLSASTMRQFVDLKEFRKYIYFCHK